MTQALMVALPMRIAVSFILVTLACQSACRPRSRDFNYSLGNKNYTAERSANSVFELRHGAFASIPSAVLDEVNASVLDYLKANNTFMGKPNVSRGSNALGETETQVGPTKTTICTKSFKVSARDDGDPYINVELQTCGLDVVVTDTYALNRLSGALKDKPIKMSIARMQMSDGNSERTIRIKILPTFNRRAEMLINEMHVESGFEALADLRQYTMDINETGFEEATGYLGQKVHDARKEMTESIIHGVRNYAESGLKNAVATGVVRAVNNFNKRRIAQGGWHFRVNFNQFTMTSSLLPRSIVSGKKNIGMSSAIDTAISIDRTGDALGCKTKFLKIPSADPVSDYGFAKAIEFSTIATTSAAPNTTQAEILLPQSFLNFQIWQVFGDEGECKIDVDLPAGIKGAITFTYREPMQASLDPPNERFKSKDGVMITTRFPSIRMLLSRELVAELKKHGISLNVNVAGQAEFEMGDFRHAVLFRVNRGDSTIVPHPVIESIYEDGQHQGANGFFQTLLAHIKNAPINIPGGTEAVRQGQRLLQGAIDSILKNTFERGAFSVEFGDKGSAWIESVRADQQSIRATITISDVAVPTINKPTTLRLAHTNKRVKLTDGSPNVSVISRDKLFSAFALGQADFRARLLAGEVLPPDWRCTATGSEPMGLPFGSQRIVYLSYATCGPGGENIVEVRWQFDRPNAQTVNLINSRLQYVRARFLRPGDVAAGLDQAENHAGLGEAKEKLNATVSTRWLWDHPDKLVSVTGFCTERDSDCTANADGAHFFDLELFAK